MEAKSITAEKRNREKHEELKELPGKSFLNEI